LGIIREVDEEMAKLDLTNPQDLEKYLFIKAAKITLEAVINFAKRYAELAKRMATAESDVKRKTELERIAEICRWVPANPARNFHEAVQSIIVYIYRY
jgi:pyruvate-formate lyase